MISSVLIVEDEAHKIKDLTDRISTKFPLSMVTSVSSVRNAVLKVIENDYDLIVLDMALPTFEKTGAGKGAGNSQVIGGMEIIRALKASRKSPSIIIVTQYPDIILDGTKIKLSRVSKVINEKYNQQVVSSILYSYKNKQWESAFENALGNFA